MAFVNVVGLIGRNRDDLREVTFMADSGSFYTLLAPSLASELGIQSTVRGPVVLADRRVVQIDLGMAYLRIGNREGGVPVGILDVPEPLLGVTALEALGLKVNPVDGTLEETRPYGPAVLSACHSEPARRQAGAAKNLAEGQTLPLRFAQGQGDSEGRGH